MLVSNVSSMSSARLPLSRMVLRKEQTRVSAWRVDTGRRGRAAHLMHSSTDCCMLKSGTTLGKHKHKRVSREQRRLGGMALAYTSLTSPGSQ